MEYVQPIREKVKIEAMKKILKSDNLRDYALFVLGINSWLSISDLLKLKVEEVLGKKGSIGIGSSFERGTPAMRRTSLSVRLSKMRWMNI